MFETTSARNVTEVVTREAQATLSAVSLRASWDGREAGDGLACARSGWLRHPCKRTRGLTAMSVEPALAQSVNLLVLRSMPFMTACDMCDINTPTNTSHVPMFS